jgi:hypothetical protein
MCIGMCTMLGGVVGMATTSFSCASDGADAATSAPTSNIGILRESPMSVSSQVFMAAVSGPSLHCPPGGATGLNEWPGRAFVRSPLQQG